MKNITLLDDYPRAMGHPRQDKTVYNSKERDEYVQKYIDKTNVYISVYTFTQSDENGFPLRESAKIDKVFFDFDTDQWLQDLIKFHQYCKKHNYIHRCHCSGRGGHGFVFIKQNISNKKQAIGNFQRFLCTELEIIIDIKIIGDIARIFRYPNTKNFNVNRFCVGLPESLLDKPDLTEKDIFMYASNQRFDNYWIGYKLLDLSEWDITDYLYMDYESITIDLHDIDENITLDYPDFPPCVQQWLSTPDLTDYGKFLLALFLKDQIYTKLPIIPSEIVSILKKILSKGEFNHYFGTSKGDLKRRHNGHNGIKFRRIMGKDYFMPNCYEIQQKGFCKKDCGKRNPIYM